MGICFSGEQNIENLQPVFATCCQRNTGLKMEMSLTIPFSGWRNKSGPPLSLNLRLLIAAFVKNAF